MSEGGTKPYHSFDQVWHLAGFGPECARKARFPEAQWRKLLGHELGHVSDAILDWIEAIATEAARADLRRLVDGHLELARWKPDHRYQKSGTTTQAQARKIYDQAEQVTDRLLASLWVDGHIEGLE